MKSGIRYVLLLFVFLLIEPCSLFALSLSHLQPIFTVSGGASLSHSGQSQVFTPLDLCSYHYIPHSNSTTSLWGGFAGVEIRPASSWRFIAGLGYYQPGALAITGTLIQGADPMSNDTYRYSFQTQNHQLLAEGKLYWAAKEYIQPFLMMGIGAAFNHMSDYQTNVPPFLEFTPIFSNHAQTSVSYAIGPGVDVNVSKAFRAGIAYRFTDLGAVTTGSALIDEIPISSRLKQSHGYTNQILVQFTFIPWARA